MIDLYQRFIAYQDQVYTVLVALGVFALVLVLGWYALPVVCSKRWYPAARAIYTLFLIGVYGMLIVYFVR